MGTGILPHVLGVSQGPINSLYREGWGYSSVGIMHKALGLSPAPA